MVAVSDATAQHPKRVIPRCDEFSLRSQLTAQSSLGVRTLNFTIGPLRLLLMGALLRRRRLSILASAEKKRVDTQYPANTATSPIIASKSALPKVIRFYLACDGCAVKTVYSRSGSEQNGFDVHTDMAARAHPPYRLPRQVHRCPFAQRPADHSRNAVRR